MNLFQWIFIHGGIGGIMIKKNLVMMLVSLAVGLYTSAYADSINFKDQSFIYVLPCEAVKPESDLLSHLSKQLEILPKNQRGQLIEQFWQSIETSQTPIVEKLNDDSSRVIYLWRGAEYNVRLVGGPSNDHEWLTRIPNTDIWFKEAIVKNDFIGMY